MELWKVVQATPSDSGSAPDVEAFVRSADGSRNVAAWSSRSCLDPALVQQVGGLTRFGMVIAGTVLRAGEPDEPRPWEAWGPGARARLGEAVAELERCVERHGVEILLAPSASGVASDVPSVLQFAREHGGKRVGLVIEPAAMLTGSMMGTVEDHLERLYGLSGLDVVRMVVVSGVREGAAGLEPCDVGEGILDERVIQEAVRRVGRAGLRWAVRGEGSGVECWIEEKARV